MQREKNDPLEPIQATVVWADPGGEPREVSVSMPAGSTLAQAAMASGWVNDGTGLVDLGVYNRVQAPDTLLRPGDRVEIYRPLRVNPKQARRIRAQVRQRRAKDS